MGKKGQKLFRVHKNERNKRKGGKNYKGKSPKVLLNKINKS